MSNPPDWNRAMVRPNAALKPAGDPQLWGNTVAQTVDIVSVATNGGVTVNTQARVIQGPQILQTKTRDAYARSWSLIGSVSMPFAGWELPNGLDATAPMNPDPGARDDLISVWLEITQGVGLALVTNLVLLTAGATSQRWGLIQQQTAFNNGPYGETLLVPAAPPEYRGIDLSSYGYRQRSFAMIGALVGNQISVRVIISRGNLLSAPFVVPKVPMVVVSLALTPYSPGEGI